MRSVALLSHVIKVASSRSRVSSISLARSFVQAQLRHQAHSTALSSTLRGDGTAIEDESYRMESIKHKQKKKLDKLRADMIRRVDTPVRVNEMSVSGRIGGRSEDTTPAEPA